MTAPQKQINLLPKDKWETGVIGKLLKWALNVGRYVVVFTELIVISAFLFRFSLDRKLTDLKEEMQARQSVVESYGDFENNFRKIQKQLNSIKEINDSSVNVDAILLNISQITPIDTVYKSINIINGKVSLEGETLSEVGLATLLAKAQENDNFNEVILESVASATEKSQVIEFRMTLIL
ncbi:MAG: PilN domain-containing protein [Candidatus Beckwithbacteria bacterium]|nr:PilN domain-containing protein [Patescibacteria group bacterium]